MTTTQDATPQKRRRGLSAFETIAAVILVALVTAALTAKLVEKTGYYSAPALAEIEPLEKYGLDNRVSRNHEELIIRDFFHDRRNGVFLDVGANHYRDESNTYFLEQQLGWSGVAIDAIREFGADYAVHRPRTRYVAMFASDVADATVQFFVPNNRLVASSSREFTERYGKAGEARQIPTTTLNAVLDQAGIAKIDLLTMDIELAEPKALAGFDIDRFRPAFVCIEAHPEVRQQILEYFARHRYVVAGKYLRVDPHNLYFQPLP
jgi:FkbM family methyltransferase